MTFLLDTTIVSELRKGSAADAGVAAWFDERQPEELALSVLTIGEIRTGVERLRRRDDRQAASLDRWLSNLVQFYEDRVLFVDGDIADEWGRLLAGRSVPVVDAFLAATARIHRLTLVTRNVRDFQSLDVRTFNPFAAR